MAHVPPYTLAASVYRDSASTRHLSQDTFIEDAPQTSLRRAAAAKLERLGIASPMSDHFPTPRANVDLRSLTSSSHDTESSDSESDQASIWSGPNQNDQFDDLYDISEESDTDALPIKLSASVKRRVGKRKSHRPSLVIPSPREWPTIEKLRSNLPLSPSHPIVLSPMALETFNARSNILPSTSNAPSLDGSLTSEEMAASSCPSTPDLSQTAEDLPWEAPARLDPSAYSLLQHINNQQMNDVPQVDVIPAPASEMQEVVETLPAFGRFRLNTQNLPLPDENVEDQLSALSVPSPGGFFASLDSSVRKTWCGPAAEPTTSVAAEFYGVPWRHDNASVPPVPTLPAQYRSDIPVERSIFVKASLRDEPETARRGQFSPTELVHEVDEIDETYGDALQQNAVVNLDRTALWLSAQDNYMKAVTDDEEGLDAFRDLADVVPSTPDQASPVSEENSPGKKSVRFAEVSTQTKHIRQSPIHDGTFWEGWRHQKRSERARDVFQQRQIRVEAEHVRRTSCSRQHFEQLQGKFEVKSTERPAPQRPVSNFLPANTDEDKKALIAQVEKERQTIEQMQSAMWYAAAEKEINGGSLLTSPIIQTFRGRDNVKVLDLSGQVNCGWAWAVANDHPAAHVYTTVASDVEAHIAESSLEGPENHSVVAAPNLWELPFPSNHFDVISARNLYSQLRTLWPTGKAADEYDLTLRECMRCLKPGGFLEFGLLDAELLHPSPTGQALGVEFAFNLKTRGYDPVSGKSFLPRLKRAGFGEIKRAWMVLPVADVLPQWTDPTKSGVKPISAIAVPHAQRSIGPNGDIEFYAPPKTGSTRDIRAITGIVGARMWEQWMVKLNGEMGRSEERCLEGVAKALEESGRGNASWKCLVGWARKD